MRISVLLFFSLVLTKIGYSQEEKMSAEPYYFLSWDGDYGVPLEVAYVFADACKLRSKPTSGSETLAKLLIGDKVKVLGVSDNDTTINGVQSNWVHIEFGKHKGYIWGGLLTNDVLKMTDSTSAVWGISKIVRVDEDEIHTYASVRIFSKKQIIKQLEFEVTHGDDPANGQLEMYKSPLLTGVEHIVVYHSIAEAC